MAGFIDTIRFRFKSGDILIKLLFINIGIFLLTGVISVVCTLFNLPTPDIRRWTGVPSNIAELLLHCWTLLTYMFIHADFWHILFNMLMLYCFGRLFLNYFNPKNMGGLYVLGGLVGALLYVVAFNTIPYYIGMGNRQMIGASASVMAIIFAAAFYCPQQKVMLFLFGGIKIVYIACLIFVADFLELANLDNPGGHVAHIGGAIMGYLFAKQYAKGKDLTAGLNKLLDCLVDIFRPRHRPLKVKYKKPETDYEYNQRKYRETEDIDNILDKIKASGYSSLTKEEKKRLFDASNK
ncbi:MAG: rhomboid family intramembrane serine protease [Prevotella sp.]|jgi:membrane associated rhomboid family serine protease|nr:rhomboid family intramembrane serine protease [Prevotella sp.]